MLHEKKKSSSERYTPVCLFLECSAFLAVSITDHDIKTDKTVYSLSMTTA